ncbi:MAG: hypothetical protein ABIP34_08310 [Rhodoferax sp.]|uniref:hypothetical protein n=1 Tax=Rhodoferax sp. TaxID=50421 RepID=UPI003264D68D
MYTDAPSIPLSDDLARELNEQFVQQFGPILSSPVLVKALGYRSMAAYRQAITRDTVPVPLFQIPNRRGRFALARDVAIWLCEQRQSATTRDSARPSNDGEQVASIASQNKA